MPEERIIAVAYPPLYRAMRRLITEALGVLSDDLGDPPKWPQAEFYEPRFPAPGGVQVTLVTRPNYSEALRAEWPKIAALPSYQTVSSELKKLAEEGKAVGHWGNPDAAYTFPILEKYLSAGLHLKFQEAEFEKYYEEIEGYIFSTTATMRMYLALSGLKSEFPVLELDSRHRILTIGEETARRLWVRSYNAKSPASFGIFSLTGRARTRFALGSGDVVLECTFQYPKERTGELSVFLKRELDRAVTALRLSHAGGGAIRFYDYEYANFFPESGLFGFSEDLNPRKFSYTINNQVADSLKRRWPVSISIANRLVSEAPDVSTHLRIAIERFNSSFGNKIPADQLLDYIIALEALCSREHDAVSYRVQLRVATLIGKDAGDRRKIFDLIKNAYDERSDLSHGRTAKLVSGSFEATQTYLLTIEEAVLRAIYFFVQAETKREKKEDILKIVDAAIATQDRTTLESSVTSNY